MRSRRTSPRSATPQRPKPCRARSSRRRSMSRRPRHGRGSSYRTDRLVGWAKAHLRRAHHASAMPVKVVGTLRFAHPTKLYPPYTELMSSSPKNAAIIGAGPAGLMAAEVLAQGGADVTVYDAMPSAGRKFLMADAAGST